MESLNRLLIIASYHPFIIGVKDLRVSLKHQYARSIRNENQQYALTETTKNWLLKRLRNQLDVSLLDSFNLYINVASCRFGIRTYLMSFICELLNIFLILARNRNLQDDCKLKSAV